MTAIYIIIGVMILFNIWIIRVYIRLGKRLPPLPQDDAEYYDEEGNHLYYDRKLIAHLEKEKQKIVQQQPGKTPNH